MKWITRERPKIDRLACAWLIRRFIDPDAEILYVSPDSVLVKAKELDATPFDVPHVEYTHYKDLCTFDYFLKKHALTDPALHTMAAIIRGADTDRHDLAREAAGLWAISAGLAHTIENDDALLETGMLLYDGLYNWAKYLQKERHTRQASEILLMDVLEKYLQAKKNKQKTPPWVEELKELIQDHIDSAITLKEISRNLDINPTYLSREFSKHFDNLSFGEYIRKQRIDKAIEYLDNTNYSLTKIAYMAGFSDQSHFTRIFKKATGHSPSYYRQKDKKK